MFTNNPNRMTRHTSVSVFISSYIINTLYTCVTQPFWQHNYEPSEFSTLCPHFQTIIFTLVLSGRWRLGPVSCPPDSTSGRQFN